MAAISSIKPPTTRPSQPVEKSTEKKQERQGRRDRYRERCRGKDDPNRIARRRSQSEEHKRASQSVGKDKSRDSNFEKTEAVIGPIWAISHNPKGNTKHGDQSGSESDSGDSEPKVWTRNPLLVHKTKKSSDKRLSREYDNEPKKNIHNGSSLCPRDSGREELNRSPYNSQHSSHSDAGSVNSAAQKGKYQKLEEMRRRRLEMAVTSDDDITPDLRASRNARQKLPQSIRIHYSSEPSNVNAGEKPDARPAAISRDTQLVRPVGNIGASKTSSHPMHNGAIIAGNTSAKNTPSSHNMPVRTRALQQNGLSSKVAAQTNGFSKTVTSSANENRLQTQQSKDPRNWANVKGQKVDGPQVRQRSQVYVSPSEKIIQRYSNSHLNSSKQGEIVPLQVPSLPVTAKPFVRKESGKPVVQVVPEKQTFGPTHSIVEVTRNTIVVPSASSSTVKSPPPVNKKPNPQGDYEIMEFPRRDIRTSSPNMFAKQSHDKSYSDGDSLDELLESNIQYLDIEIEKNNQKRLSVNVPVNIHKPFPNDPKNRQSIPSASFPKHLDLQGTTFHGAIEKSQPRQLNAQKNVNESVKSKKSLSLPANVSPSAPTHIVLSGDYGDYVNLYPRAEVQETTPKKPAAIVPLCSPSETVTQMINATNRAGIPGYVPVMPKKPVPQTPQIQISVAPESLQVPPANHRTDISPDSDAGEGLILPVTDEGMFSDVDYNIEVSERIKKWETYMVKKDDDQKKAPSMQTPPIRKRAILEPIEERREFSEQLADSQNMVAAKHLEHILKKKTDGHMDNFPLHQSLSDTSVNRSFDKDASDSFADFLANSPKRSQDFQLEYDKSPSPIHHHRQRTLFGDEIWEQYRYEQSERKPNRQEKSFSLLHPLDMSVSQPTLYTPVTTYSSSITVDNSQPYYGVANNTNRLTLEQKMLSTGSQYDNFMASEKDDLRDDDVFEVKSDSVKSLARMFDSKDSPSSPNRDDRSREESRSTRTSVSQQESESDWTNLITDLQGKIKDLDVWSPNMESDQGLVSIERVKARTLQTVPFSEDPFWKEIEDMTRMDDVFRDKISQRSPASSAPKSPETRRRHISPLVSSSIYEQGFFPQHESNLLSVKSRKRPVSLYCPSALPMPKVDRYHSTEALDDVLNDMKLTVEPKSTGRKMSKVPGAVLSPTALSILSPGSAEKQVFFPQRYHSSTITSGSLLDDTIRSLGEISKSKPSGYSHSHENLAHGFSKVKETPPPPPAPLEGKKEYPNVVNGNYQLDPKILKNKLLSTGLVEFTPSDAETFSNQETSYRSPMYRDTDAYRDEQMRQSMDDLRTLAKEVEVKVDQIKKKILQSREENLDKILVSLRKHVPSATKADMGARNIFVKKDTTKFRKSKLVDALSELERIYEDLDLDNELLMDRAARREITCLSVPAHEDKSSRKSPLNEAISPYCNLSEEWVKSRAYEPSMNLNHQPEVDDHMQEFEAIDRCFQTLLQEVNSYSLGPSPPGQLKRDSSHESLSSEIRRSQGRKIPYPDKVNDDLATRRFGHSSTPSSKQDFLSPPSYTSPVVSPQQNRRSNSLKGGANVILDDVAYRKSRSQSGSRDDNQRTPTAQSPTSADYLKPRSRSGRTRMRLRPEKEPDIMQDDMAYRNLRREDAGPEDFPKPPPRSSSLHRRKLRKDGDMNRRKSMPFEVVDKRTVETQTGDTDTRDDQTSSTSSPAVRRARNREPSSSESSNENKKLRRRSLSRGIARMVDIFSSSDEDKKRRGSQQNTTSKTGVTLKQKENAIISKVPANSPSCIRKLKDNGSKPVTIAVDTAETATQSQSKSTPRLVKQRHEARRQRQHRVEIVPKEQVKADEDLISPVISKTAETSKIEGDVPANPLYPWRKSRSSSLENAAKVEPINDRITSAESNSRDMVQGVSAPHGTQVIDASPPVVRRRKLSNQNVEQLERRWSFHDLVATFETDLKRIEKLKTLRKATSGDNLVQETVINKTYHSEPDLRKHPDVKTLDTSNILLKLEMKVQY